MAKIAVGYVQREVLTIFVRNEIHYVPFKSLGLFPKMLDVNKMYEIIEKEKITKFLVYACGGGLKKPHIANSYPKSLQVIAALVGGKMDCKPINDYMIRTYIGGIKGLNVAHRNGDFGKLLSRAVIFHFGASKARLLFRELGNACALELVRSLEEEK